MVDSSWMKTVSPGLKPDPEAKSQYLDMEVLKVEVILLDHGTDRVVVTIAAPGPLHDQEHLCLLFEAPRNGGVDYVENVMHLTPVVIDGRKK